MAVRLFEEVIRKYGSLSKTNKYRKRLYDVKRLGIVSQLATLKRWTEQLQLDWEFVAHDRRRTQLTELQKRYASEPALSVFTEIVTGCYLQVQAEHPGAVLQCLTPQLVGMLKVELPLRKQQSSRFLFQLEPRNNQVEVGLLLQLENFSPKLLSIGLCVEETVQQFNKVVRRYFRYCRAKKSGGASFDSLRTRARNSLRRYGS